MKTKKLSRNEQIRMDVCIEMYGVELDDLTLYEIYEFMFTKPSDEELYSYVLDKIEENF